MKAIHSFLALLLIAGPFALPAKAERVDILGSFTDWSYAVFENPKVCVIISRPIDSKARRNGAAVDVDHGDTTFEVAVVPGNPQSIQPIFSAGYPLDQENIVQMRIRDTTVSLYPFAETDPKKAWTRPEDDSRLIAAMRGGAEAIVNGRSARGTDTIYTISLIGFTAALEKAQELCQ